MVIMLCFHSFPVHSLSLPFHSKSINQSNSQWNPPLSSTTYLLSLLSLSLSLSSTNPLPSFPHHPPSPPSPYLLPFKQASLPLFLSAQISENHWNPASRTFYYHPTNEKRGSRRGCFFASEVSHFFFYLKRFI